jgi:L-fucose isomerase
MTEILRRMKLEIYDHEEYERALAWTKANCKEGLDKNAGKKLADIVSKSKVVPPDKDWEFVVKMTIICRDVMLGNPKLDELGWHEEALGRNAVAGGFQGQRMWTDWLPNGDYLEAIINSSFDWQGKRQPIPFATENDTLNGVTMLMLNMLTGKAPLFSDVRTYWSPNAVERVTGKKLDGVAKNGLMHLINSGATALDAAGTAKDADGKGCMKQWWNMSDTDISACLGATDWCRANYEYFRGGGFSSHFKTEAEMPVTMARLSIVEGVGPVMQIAEGWTAVLDEEIHNKLDARTDPTWPTTWFAPRLTGKDGFADVYSVMANWGANHGAWVHGHIGQDLITLCSMLRIPVSMHNVEDAKIYRPHVWSAFGTKDLESADYRTCKEYGPLYD